MNTHKLLQKQINKFLPEVLRNDPGVQKFLHAINESYSAYERDAALSDRAFRISEEEYVHINQQLEHEVYVRRKSVEKLKQALGTITGEDKNSNMDDLLIIARYLTQQVGKRKKAEQIFSSLITNMQNAILLEDEHRHIVFTNQAFCDMFGIPESPDSLQGSDCSSSAEQSKHLFKEPEKFVLGIQRLMQNKALVTAEILELADGRIFERDYIPIFVDEKYRGHYWSYHDITERKRTQDAIAKSELTNRLILNAALDAIVIINDKGEVTFWNPQAEKIFGWQEEEILGRTLTETIIPYRHGRLHQEGLYHYHQTGEGPVLGKIFETTAINKSGLEFPVELSIIPVKQDNGTFFCGFIRDISARKKAEADLKASEELWQFALEGAGDGVWEYDFETTEVYFSKQYKLMLGYEEDEFENDASEWLGRIHPDDLHIIDETDRDYYSGKITSHKREYRVKHKSGEYLWILDRGKIINYTRSGKPKRIIGTHTDITTRKNIEKEYRRISLVASANENGVVFTDPHGKIIWSNEGFAKISGYDIEEIFGKTPLELCQGELSEKEAIQNMVSAFFEGRSFNIEVLHYRKDGTTFWGRVTGQATNDANGNVVQYFAIIEDITEEKEVKRKLKEYDERLKLALTNVGDNYWEHNLKTGTTYFSNKSSVFLGYAAGEYDNAADLWWNCVHPNDKKLLEENNLKYQQGLIDHHTNEYRLIHKNGSIKWVLDRGVVTEFDENGKPMVIIGTHIDITERKLSEQAIKLKEEKYRSIIANMNLGLLEVDNAETIQFANQSFCEMSGYSIEELIGKKASMLFAKGENEELLEQKNDLRKKGISDAYEIALKNKRGELKWWLISGAPRFNDNGELVGSIGIHLDITQQKQLEIELIEAREQAESSVNAKQTFLANMSHEIRTPMNAILGMTNQLAKTKLNKDQHFYLSTIHSAADNLLIIINDILDLSKIEAGKLTLEKIGFEPQTVMNRVMQVMMHRAEEKGLYFTNSFCDAKLSPVLIGDPYRLNQVLLNLVSNAIKFTHQGGVDISCNVLMDAAGKQTIEIKVADTGIGMDENFASKLFEKFSQEDSSVMRKYGGTGLGMSITKELVDLMEAAIKVESKKNEGTTIAIVIPLEKGNMNDLPYKEVTITDTSLLKGKKILVTDDNEMNQLVAGTILNNYGAEVYDAYNGAEAIEKIKEYNIDLVLMDVQMPVMDGIEATKHIRAGISTTLPVIALTAFAINGDNQKCLAAGMNDYLSKPFEEAQLLNIVSKWLGKSLPQQQQRTGMLQEERLFDLSKLNEIARGNTSFVDKMVKLFIEQMPVALEEIKAAYLEKNFEAIKKIAHRIKPSIDNMGISTLKTEIREIESMATESNHNGRLVQLIQLLESTLTKVLEELKKIMQQEAV
ncbi:MAG: PAS domain S-box protein [Bacteroidetes bacterium]|nr:PAS domain S-box protein [Bacteroidota bacterium]